MISGKPERPDYLFEGSGLNMLDCSEHVRWIADTVTFQYYNIYCEIILIPVPGVDGR